MNEGLIARRYAIAMLKVAQKFKAAGEVYEKMKLFEKNYTSHPDLHRVLMNPILSPVNKEQLLIAAIGVKPGDLYTQGIKLLIRNHREMYVRTIGLTYQKLYRKAYHIDQVKIITAVELDLQTTERIKKLITDKTSRQIELLKQIDPAIIGGFILRINSTQLDASVSNGLKQLHRQLL